MLIREDPVEAKKLGILPGNVDISHHTGAGKIEDDQDQGLEAQVSSIVEKSLKEHEERITDRLNDLEGSLNSTMRAE